MKDSSRRDFVKKAGAAAALLPVAGIAAEASKAKNMKNIFVHQVYFWLKTPGSQEDKAKLIEGLTTLTKIKTIKSYHMGVPAGTSREVIDASYSISWLNVFKNRTDQDAYQVDPIHLKFVKEYAHLWTKVVVYDSVDVPKF